MGSDNRKWVLTSIVVFSMVLWFLFERFLQTVFDIVSVQNVELFSVVPTTYVIAVVLAVVTGGVLTKNEKTTTFLNEVLVELKKVVWPTKNETIASTVVVVITVAIFAVILGGFDFIWSKLMAYILS